MGVRSRSPLKTGAQFGLSVTSATVVTLTVPNTAMCAEIYVRTAPVTFTRDGTAPTATLGLQAQPMDTIMLNSRAELDNFKAIAVGATLTLDCEFFTDISG